MPGSVEVIAILENWAGGITVLAASVFMQLAVQMFLAHMLVASASIGAGDRQFGRAHLLSLQALRLLTVFTLIFGHLAQVFLWTLLYLALRAFDAFADVAYFSLASYTTIGAADLELPRGHRVLGAIEAWVGVLMFGWSTALLVALVGRTEDQWARRDAQ